MRTLFIPLDERPVNTRYPRMLAQMVGADLWQPPPTMLSQLREPADTTALADWLLQQVMEADVLIVAMPTFGYGGLIASRINSQQPASDAAQDVQ